MSLMDKVHEEVKKAFYSYMEAYFDKRDFEETMNRFGYDIHGFGSSKDENAYTYEDCYRLYKRDVAQAPNKIDYEIDDLVIKTPNKSVAFISCEFSLETMIKNQRVRFNHLRYTLGMVKKAGVWRIEHKHLSLPSTENEADEAYPIKELEARNEALKRMVDEKTEELKKALDKITVLANTDALSGLSNRHCINETLTNMLEKVNEQRDALSVMMIDIDNFKLVNDEHGHLKGDEVIKNVAEVLKSSLDKHFYLGRWGGDEFIVLMPKLSLNAAKAVGEDLRETLASEPMMDIGIITVSIGLAKALENDTLITIISRADQALYKAKKEGKNNVQIHI